LNFAQMLLPDNPLRNRVSFNRTRFGVYRVPRNRLWRGSRKYRQPYQVEASCLQIKFLSSDQVLCPLRSVCARIAASLSPPLCAISGSRGPTPSHPRLSRESTCVPLKRLASWISDCAARKV
jgi:hypothetical protein